MVIGYCYIYMRSYHITKNQDLYIDNYGKYHYNSYRNEAPTTPHEPRPQPQRGVTTMKKHIVRRYWTKQAAIRHALGGDIITRRGLRWTVYSPEEYAAA